ncbi:competence protein [Sphingopyxis sp. Root1497]|uniref:CinA family protein n=1 Tax=Sphingopyxis sp. Root1497 TaxID=1736474 RepID=UPI0007007F3B|nr:CinA family protein [Sphingopyxis sp. Root1497]KQZ61755.1 competence protein [Sphingopyxis sp. Root1497]
MTDTSAVPSSREAARGELATRVLTNNRAAGRRVAVAESCTGGMVCAALTDIAGSSDVFSAGFITYSGAAKQAQLDVSSEILETFGEVSLATAWAMVAGALANSDADVAVAITGIAGPGGGSEKKPVGQVVFARGLRGQDPDDYFTQRVQFEGGDRAGIRHAATLFALDLLLPERDALRPSEDIALPAG